MWQPEAVALYTTACYNVLTLLDCPFPNPQVQAALWSGIKPQLFACAWLHKLKDSSIGLVQLPDDLVSGGTPAKI